VKKALVLMLAALCVVILIGRSAAETEPAGPPGAWTAIGPFGGNITGLARNPQSPSELFAVCGSYPAQVFRSANNGASWTRQSMFYNRVYDLVLDPKSPSTIYCLCDSSIQVSKDKGKTFTGFGLPTDFQVWEGRLAVHPTNPKIMIAGGYFIYDKTHWHSAAAVAKTTDGGAHWTVTKLSQNTD
jgi:hypothetical protein